MKKESPHTPAPIQRQPGRNFFTPSVHPDSGTGISAKSGGHALPVSTRGEMEHHFGSDFSHVRVHTDDRAAEMNRSLGAHAFTHGNDIYFNKGRYDPSGGNGKRILAHELTHVVQQRGKGPSIQCLRVTNGEYGKALEEYTRIHNVPDKLIRLLAGSAEFMKVAVALDRHYVWRTTSFNWERKHQEALEYDASNRITNKSAPFKGKKELMVVGGGTGALFEPEEAPSSSVSGDAIIINSTSGEEFIRQAVHESIHARNHITGGGGVAPATLADHIAAGLKEETSTRADEEKIISGIAKAKPSMNFGPAASTDPDVVKKEFSPGLGMTYIENLFFTWRLQEAKAKDRIDDEKAGKIWEKVKAGNTLQFQEFIAPSGLIELSDYAQVAADYLKVQKEWAQLMEKRRGDPNLAAFQDAMLKDHAKRFFEKRVTL
ncbi:eCIS core domain-containing protein [Chitinophaga sp. 22620]|uniref:eCIS core domain-containing protein n=1 Tax=Chitinophaga sp. 22620 TaxID=3453952 RepID=UPI003F85E6A8